MHLRHYLDTKSLRRKAGVGVVAIIAFLRRSSKPGAVKGTLDIAIAVIINFIGQDTTCQIATKYSQCRRRVRLHAGTRSRGPIITIGIISNMVLRLRAG